MKKFHKKLVCVAVAGGVALCGGLSTQAIPMITGEISFFGLQENNGGTDLANATAFTAFPTVMTFDATGDFSAYAPSQATMTPYQFRPSFNTSPPGGSIPIMAFWQLASDPGVNFDLHTSAIVTQTSSLLSLTGTGILHMPGKEATPGTWSIAVPSTGGGMFTFSSTTTAVVPDGGLTLAMLGMGLSGLALLRRKLG